MKKEKQKGRGENKTKGDKSSGVARAFPGGRLSHPEGQNEEENEKSFRNNKKN